jgi:uncharacterized UBP type Zn finger protein
MKIFNKKEKEKELYIEWKGGLLDGQNTNSPDLISFTSDPYPPGSIEYCGIGTSIRTGIYSMYIASEVKDNKQTMYFIGYGRGPWLDKK